MPNNTYHGDDMTITLKTEDGTDVNVGEAKGVTVTPTAEHNELYSADSIKRSAVKRREAKVNVEIEVAAWDVEMIKQWLGGDGTSSSTFEDSTDPQLFNLVGTVTPSDSGTDLEADVTGVYFEEMPVFDASEEEWVTESLSGTGADVTVSGETTA